jgi:hypothetical protein
VIVSPVATWPTGGWPSRPAPPARPTNGPPVTVTDGRRGYPTRRRLGQRAETAKLKLSVLEPFNVLEVRQENSSSEPLVRAVAPAAGFFLRSLAAFVRENQFILSNWERPGNSDGPLYSVREILTGPQFLYLIERERIAGRNDALPLREVEIAQVVVKARIRGQGKAMYLVQYDDVAREYQLVGGYQRKQDRDMRETIIREIEEELPSNPFDFRGRDSVTPLGAVALSKLSRTFGVNTLYNISFFQLHQGVGGLILGPNDAWVTERELLAGKTKGGHSINTSALQVLDKQLPGGLDGLKLSLPGTQRRSLRKIAKEHPWEVAGLAIGILALLLKRIGDWVDGRSRASAVSGSAPSRLPALAIR